MFGRRKREQEAAAEAAREAERRALFAKLAERPEHICPFLGLAGERTGYVDGVSDEHRCFAFGDPTPLSAEQQTRVCQERGYGNCPRYLRGVLVIPTEELEALRRPRAAQPLPPPPPPPTPSEAEPGRRRRAPILLLVGAIVLLAGGVGAYLALTNPGGTAVASPTPTGAVSPPAPTTTPLASTSAVPSISQGAATPTPEPTPELGDAFSFYEVSVGPDEFGLYRLDGAGSVVDTRTTSFRDFSFAQVEPVLGADDNTYWVTTNGDLAGWAYRFPDSGPFRIRAVFLADDGSRRSFYLEESQLTTFPEETPAPVP